MSGVEVWAYPSLGPSVSSSVETPFPHSGRAFPKKGFPLQSLTQKRVSLQIHLQFSGIDAFVELNLFHLTLVICAQT